MLFPFLPKDCHAIPTQEWTFSIRSTPNKFINPSPVLGTERSSAQFSNTKNFFQELQFPESSGMRRWTRESEVGEGQGEKHVWCLQQQHPATRKEQAARTADCRETVPPSTAGRNLIASNLLGLATGIKLNLMCTASFVIILSLLEFIPRGKNWTEEQNVYFKIIIIMLPK